MDIDRDIKLAWGLGYFKGLIENLFQDISFKIFITITTIDLNFTTTVR